MVGFCRQTHSRDKCAVTEGRQAKRLGCCLLTHQRYDLAQKANISPAPADMAEVSSFVVSACHVFREIGYCDSFE